MNVCLKLFGKVPNKMVTVHDYEKRFVKASVHNNEDTGVFKQEHFYIIGGAWRRVGGADQ